MWKPCSPGGRPIRAPRSATPTSSAVTNTAPIPTPRVSTMSTLAESAVASAAASAAGSGRGGESAASVAGSPSQAAITKLRRTAAIVGFMITSGGVKVEDSGERSRRASPASNALQLLQRARPVLAQDPAEGAIGQDAAARLATRAVVRLPIRVDDPLDGGATDGARLAVLAVHGHPGTKGGDLLREPLAGLCDPDLRPLAQDLPRAPPQPLDLLVREVRVHLERREPGAMEDLVGERPADARERARIGERPLERVALSQERRAEAGGIGALDLDPARIERGQGVLSPQEMEPRAPLRSGLDEEQRSRREVERREAPLPRDRPRLLRPPEATGDHQVEGQEELALEREDDPLPEPPEDDDPLSRCGFERGLPGREQGHRSDPDSLQAGPHDARLERVQVGGDLGKLGHAPNLAGRGCRSQARPGES